MAYDPVLLAQKLQRWQQFTDTYRLPEWESIPKFGLYMDQVIVLLQEYLHFIGAPDHSKDSFVTASTINNYVRLKVMPAPEKRKYGRVHLAYLIMILTLKLSLSISDLQKLLPADLAEDEVRFIYEDYSGKFHRMMHTFSDQLQTAAQSLPTDTHSADTAASSLVVECALSAGFHTLFAEKMIRLNGAASEEADTEKADL